MRSRRLSRPMRRLRVQRLVDFLAAIDSPRLLIWGKGTVHQIFVYFSKLQIQRIGVHDAARNGVLFEAA